MTGRMIRNTLVYTSVARVYDTAVNLVGGRRWGWGLGGTWIVVVVV